jgi:hypothetical protein
MMHCAVDVHRIDLGLHSELQQAIALESRDHVTTLNTEHGKAFSVDGFSQFIGTQSGTPSAIASSDWQRFSLRHIAYVTRAVRSR